MDKCPWCGWYIDWNYVNPGADSEMYEGEFTCRSCGKQFKVTSWVEHEITKVEE